MLTRGKRRILFWLSVAFFLALVPVTVLYSLGYRFDRNFVLRKTGGLYIASDVSGSEIFINGEFERRTNLLQSGVFVQNLAPNKYKVLVAREGYLGWSKELQIFSRFVSEARAVLVPAETNGKIILKGRFSGLGASHDGLWLIEKKGAREVFQSYDPENNILGATSSSPVPALSEKTDSRGYAKAVWNEKSLELKVFWLREALLPYYLQDKEEILLAGKNVRNFEFFPKRRDVLIAAFDNGVWAVELDGHGGRGSYPIYKGKEPDFALLAGDDVLYVLDDGNLIRVSLLAAE